jgi:cytidine deaminase
VPTFPAVPTVDWAALRKAATEAMTHAYAPYSRFPVGAAGLVDDGRIIVGCNVENASYGLSLCAECGLVSALHASGGGRLVAMSCVDGAGAPLMPCGRCRQLLWEQGGPECLIDHADGPIPMAELLPYAFDAEELDRAGRARVPLPLTPRVQSWQGRGTVFVHPDRDGGQPVWTAYWERSSGFADDAVEERGILEEGPLWTEARDAVAWGLARTPRVVVVDADGALFWAGTDPAPAEVTRGWTSDEEPA